MLSNVGRRRLQRRSQQLRGKVRRLFRVEHPLLFEHAMNPRFLATRAVIPIELPPRFASSVGVALDRWLYPAHVR